MKALDRFEEFTPAMRILEPLSQGDSLPDSFRLFSDAELAIYYAPFDYVNPDARLVIVGLTPGRTQAINALNAARAALAANLSDTEAAQKIKTVSSFSGQLRNNLVALLDRFGLHHWLRVGSTRELFEARHGLVHFTSVLRYPVFTSKGENFNGSALRHAELRRMVNDNFYAELAQLPKALFVPLGNKAREVLSAAIQEGRIDEARVLDGIVHPSGANQGRVMIQLAGHTEGRADRAAERIARDTQEVWRKVCLLRGLSPDTPLPIGVGKGESLPVPPHQAMPANGISKQMPVVSSVPRAPTVPMPATRSRPGGPLGFSAARAELVLRERCRELGKTQKIVGFSTLNGRHIALQRDSKTMVCVWIEFLIDFDPREPGVEVLNRSSPGCEYKSNQPRNSNINDSTAPRLKRGNRAWYLRIEHEEALLRLLDKYAGSTK